MIKGLETYDSAPPIDEELKGQFKALRIVSFMRWITFFTGPMAIILDDYLQPLLLKKGLPSLLTMEDLSRWIFLDVLGLSNYIDEELFLVIYHHVNNISCVLFVVFVVWVAWVKRKAVIAARDLAILEGQMRGGV